MKTFRQFVLEYSQSELGSLSQSINQSTRNSPIKKQQPQFQSSQSEPQRPTGVPIPGSRMAVKQITNLGRAAVSGIINK